MQTIGYHSHLLNFPLVTSPDFKHLAQNKDGSEAGGDRESATPTPPGSASKRSTDSRSRRAKIIRKPQTSSTNKHSELDGQEPSLGHGGGGDDDDNDDNDDDGNGGSLVANEDALDNNGWDLEPADKPKGLSSRARIDKSMD